MRARQIYKALLLCYPAAFRNEYGGQMLLVFSEQLGEARRSGGLLREAALWLHTAWDALSIAPREHAHVIGQDLRFAVRSIASSPSFAAVAILSLTLGIGANTAIFSMWDGLLRGDLPLVTQPEQLVMLTNPDRVGAWIGSWGGERPWLSFDEFERLRLHADSFAGMFAAQSYLDQWQARTPEGDWDDVRGRLVSAGFFDVLGVQPPLGRLFTSDNAAEAVISHAYWQSRFGGAKDALGKSIVFRGGTLTVVGVAPAGFSGETLGQQPEVWAPLGAQRLVRPGQDWLRDSFPLRNMWLHVFGRLKPGVTAAQAEAQANAIFRQSASAFSRSAPPNLREQALEEYLRIHPAGRGVAAARLAYSNSLTTLLAGVAALLLIACANLANLLLARGAARRPELVLRVSLGASRGRLMRQLMTESVLLAAMGGLASLAAAYVLRAGLAWMMAQNDPGFRMEFQMSGAVLGFTLAVTLTAAALFGLLPAWQATRPDQGDLLKQQGRHSTMAPSRLRWGKLLVSVQLALSLPLLVGAGLMARTLYNERRIDLGYRAEGLLLARLDTTAAHYDAARRDAVLGSAVEDLARMPEIESASFGAIGVFAGSDIVLPVLAEGQPPGGLKNDGASIELAAPNYFTAAGIPLLRGRGIERGDRAGATAVCVVNETFARLRFPGTDALGKQITVFAPGGPALYQIAGIASDSRWQNLRAPIRPRVYLPWTQSSVQIDGATALIRVKTSGGASVEPAIRRQIRQVFQRTDPSLPLRALHTVEEQMIPMTSQDRSLAMLAEVFGSAALALAAIGLYGVLSFSVTQRRGEVAIRMALGAQAARVTAAVLSETAWLVVAGLVLGLGLAYWATHLIRIRLFGVAPEDAGTLTAAIGVLIAVAAAAAYFPARRAARLDPIAALREE